MFKQFILRTYKDKEEFKNEINKSFEKYIIHVNTVAPFGTFRTKIRKWKKIAL